MRDVLQRLLRRVFRSAGLDLVRYPGYGSVPYFLRHAHIDAVIDVGANIGQTGALLRGYGFEGRILSFEPLSEPFSQLKRRAAADPKWTCWQYALGSADGQADIHVADSTVYSSFLTVKPDFVAGVDQKSAQTRVETVQVRTLDGLWSSLQLDGARILLKVDTQGFERQVLEGAAASLPHIAGVQLEMSIRALYEGQNNYMQMIQHMESLGYAIAGLAPGWNAPDTGQLLEFDCVFIRVPRGQAGRADLSRA